MQRDSRSIRSRAQGTLLHRLARTLSLVLAFSHFSARADALPTHGRVAVFDVQLVGVLAPEASQLPDLIGQLLQSHHGFDVVPESELHKALAAESDDPSACLINDRCRRRVARAARADIAVFGSVVKREGRFFLYLGQSPAGETAGEPTHTSESMKSLKSLPNNVTLCLDRLFDWSAPSQERVSVPPAGEPPSAQLPVSDPGKPVATPASTKDTKSPAPRRVIVLDLLTTGVDAAIAAPLPAMIAGTIAEHHGFTVASAEEVRRLTQHEQQKQSLGCQQDSACLLEISRKLEADLIVEGSVGRVGRSWVLALTLIDPRAAGGATRASETFAQPEELPNATARAVKTLFHWEGGVERTRFQLPKRRKLSFAVFDLRPTGLPTETAQNLTQVLSTEVKGVEGASVVSRDDINALLQLEQAKQKTGCDDAECMAQIGGALGVDLLIAGDAGKLGGLYLVNLRLLNVRTGEVENRATETFAGDEEQLLRAVRRAARSLLGITPAGKGQLAVTASQNTADVFVDDGASGRTPIKLNDLVVGKHQLRVAQSGYFDWHGDVYVDPWETTSVWAQLSPRPQPWYRQWWVWTVAGAVVSAAVITGVVVGRPATGDVTGIISPAH